MENENMNIVEETENEAVEIDVEEIVDEEAVAEEAIVEEPTEEETAEEATSEESASEMLSRKCAEVKQACCDTIDRIARDLKESNYKPYFKQTRTYKLEVYRDCNEEEPIDVYETEDVKSFSARALLAASATAMVLTWVTKNAVKKILK